MFPLLTVERRSRPRDWRAATLKAKPVVDAVPLQAEMLNAADRALARHHTKEHVHCTARCWQRSALLCEGTTTAPPHASKRCPDRTDLQRRICCRANEIGLFAGCTPNTIPGETTEKSASSALDMSFGLGPPPPQDAVRPTIAASRPETPMRTVRFNVRTDDAGGPRGPQDSCRAPKLAC
jgi:hypothetical protein